MENHRENRKQNIKCKLKPYCIITLSVSDLNATQIDWHSEWKIVEKLYIVYKNHLK
jgi:hypothetical protein